MDEGIFAEGLKAALFDFISGDVDYATRRDSRSGTKVMLLNQALKARPDLKKTIRKELINTPIEDLYDLDQMRRLSCDALDFLSRLFRNDGVFCTTVDCNNLLMWAHYGDQHRGAVVELTPSVEKDSPLLVSREVHYTDIRPLLYKDPVDMVTHGLAMTLEESAWKIYDGLVYTKSSEWAYEKEFRLHIPGFIPDDKEYSTLSFYAEELTSVYVGCRMKEEHRMQTISLARAINPSVELLDAHIVPREFRLEYGRMSDI